MEARKGNLKTFGRHQRRPLIADRRDFLLLTLSITSGLLIFTVSIYLILKLSSSNLFGSSSSKTEPLDTLDTIDNVVEEKEKVEEKEEEKVEVEEKEEEMEVKKQGEENN